MVIEALTALATHNLVERRRRRAAAESIGDRVNEASEIKGLIDTPETSPGDRAELTARYHKKARGEAYLRASNLVLGAIGLPAYIIGSGIDAIKAANGIKPEEKGIRNERVFDVGFKAARMAAMLPIVGGVIATTPMAVSLAGGWLFAETVSGIYNASRNIAVRMPKADNGPGIYRRLTGLADQIKPLPRRHVNTNRPTPANQAAVAPVTQPAAA